jgi:DsbC/DsbD-like thiol-disulfide interchange protein
MIWKFLLCVLLAGFSGAAQAQATSDWSSTDHSRLRLISTGLAPDGRNPAAVIEIELDAGFKTYWRNPGESGVPPLLTFEGSDNIASATLMFPVPTVFEDESGQSIGYHDRVMLPLRIRAADPAKPARLKVQLNYGVCEKLCIPAEGVADIALGTKPSAALQAVLDAAIAAVPPIVGLAEQPDAFAIRDITLLPHQGRKQSAIIRFAAPEGTRIFAEGPEGWFVESSSSATAPGEISVTVNLFGPRRALVLKPCPIRITLANKDNQLERHIPLDQCESKP